MAPATFPLVKSLDASTTPPVVAALMAASTSLGEALGCCEIYRAQTPLTTPPVSQKMIGLPVTKYSATMEEISETSTSASAMVWRYSAPVSHRRRSSRW